MSQRANLECLEGGHVDAAREQFDLFGDTPDRPPLDRLRLIGNSGAFREPLAIACRVAISQVPVMVLGETGTGKENVARAIHSLSRHRGGPFVPVNCGAMPDGLLESELFGHERGAFTDARGRHTGFVAQADGGTLFLDEVDSLSVRGQVVLLRFLQNQEYRPLGARNLQKASVRVISACNRDLPGLAAAGSYRTDLLFRLGPVSITLPPLRERGQDAELLALHFVEEWCRSHGEPTRTMTQQTLDAIKSYDWPGNVRELENFIQGACALSRRGFVELTPGLINGPLQQRRTWPAPAGGLDAGFQEAKARVIAEFERAYLARVLARSGGNVTRAAELAGKERRALGKLLKKYGLQKGA
jgi:DNA-binding NtrC family response regulator